MLEMPNPPQKVYSSTFKKTITGWNYPGNGISAERDTRGELTTSMLTGNPDEVFQKYKSPYKFDQNIYRHI